jgi:HK97 family phage major capsid protein
MPFISTLNTPDVWHPDANVFAPADAIADAAILQHSLVSAQILGDQPVMRVGYVSDADAEYHSEGTPLAETDPDLNEIEVITQEIGYYTEMTRDQFRQRSTPEELAASVSRSIIKKADRSFLAETNPTAPAVRPIGGLINYPGLTSQTGVSSLDKLIDLEADVRAAGGDPTSWILAPTTWAALRKLKTGGATGAGSNESVLGAGTSDAEPRLLSIPVVLNAALPAGSGLLVDNQEIISAASTVEVDVDHSAAFRSVMVAVRGTWRIGYGVPRPARVGTFQMS